MLSVKVWEMGDFPVKRTVPEYPLRRFHGKPTGKFSPNFSGPGGHLRVPRPVVGARVAAAVAAAYSPRWL
jgi:hypothetical protein